MDMLSDIRKKIAKKILTWLTHDLDAPREFPLSNFERIQYELRPCDVILLEGRSRVSHVIQMITQSPWSHAALYLGRLYDIQSEALREQITQYYQGDPHDQLIIETLMDEGVVISPLAKYKEEHIRICRPKGLSFTDAQKVIAYAVNHLGYPYDMRLIVDLARFLLPWSFIPHRWHSTLFETEAGQVTRLSCSMLLAEAFASVNFPILPLIRQHKEVGVELIQRNARLFTPSDFDYSPFFDIIKYPIFELSHTVDYHDLPWNKDGLLYDDKGQFELVKEPLKKIPD